jgi:hypothetical protein
MVNGESAEPTTARREINQEMRQMRRRRAYVRGRLPGLKEEMKLLIAEKHTLKAIDPEAEAPAAPEAKKLKRRRLYITSRLEWLRSERRALVAERSALSAKFKVWADPLGGTPSPLPAAELSGHMQPAE